MKLKQALTLMLLICGGGVNAAHAYELGDASQPITGGIISWDGYNCQSGPDIEAYCTVWPGSHQFGDCHHKATIPHRQLPNNKDQYGGRPAIKMFSSPYNNGFVESWNEGGVVRFAFHIPGSWWKNANGSFQACVKGPD